MMPYLGEEEVEQDDEERLVYGDILLVEHPDVLNGLL